MKRILAAAASPWSRYRPLRAAGDDSDSGGKTKVVFSYWGSDTRQKLTESAIATFEGKNPTIDIEGDFSDWDSYYEKLATKTAAGDAPDVMSIEIRGLAEYAGRATLADLTGKVNTADLDQDVLEAGRRQAVRHPPRRRSLPDDRQQGDGGEGGPEGPGRHGLDLGRIHLDLPEGDREGRRQDLGHRVQREPRLPAAVRRPARGAVLQGRQDRHVGADRQGLVGPPAEDHLHQGRSERRPDAGDRDRNVDQALLATNASAFGSWWSNQLTALSKGSGQELDLLRMPKAEGATTAGMFLQPAMYYTISSKTEKADAAQKFVDFLVNDPEAGAILLSDRGLPTNPKVVAAIKDKLTPADQKVLTFIDSIRSELSPIAIPPKGSMEMEDILKRATDSVLFERPPRTTRRRPSSPRPTPPSPSNRHPCVPYGSAEPYGTPASTACLHGVLDAIRLCRARPPGTAVHRRAARRVERHRRDRRPLRRQPDPARLLPRPDRTRRPVLRAARVRQDAPSSRTPSWSPPSTPPTPVYVVAALEAGRTSSWRSRSAPPRRTARRSSTPPSGAPAGSSSPSTTATRRATARSASCSPDGAIGDVTSVHFEWVLDTIHGADYFRRWHRDKANSGGLLVHKSTHHFDLVNWWIADAPAPVYARGGLRFYGADNAAARGLRDAAEARARRDRTGTTPSSSTSPPTRGSSASTSTPSATTATSATRTCSATAITIEDNMAVLVDYARGATLSYSLNAHSPVGGLPGRRQRHRGTARAGGRRARGCRSARQAAGRPERRRRGSTPSAPVASGSSCSGTGASRGDRRSPPARAATAAATPSCWTTSSAAPARTPWAARRGTTRVSPAS